MKHVNAAVVGFGKRASCLGAESEKVTKGVMKITASVEPDEDHFSKNQENLGHDITRYSSIGHMLSNEKPALVIIASPNFCHLENLREFETHDIPLLLEKPLEAGWEKINEIMRFALRYPAPVMVGHCMRYAPILRKARELIEQGVLGRISSAEFCQNCFYGNIMYHGWRREKCKSGTLMLEKATHDLDVMQWLLNTKASGVYASSRLVAFGGDKSPELRCRNCSESMTCPESPANIRARWDGRMNGETLQDDLCVFSGAVDTPDDEICLIQFDNGIHGTYTQTFFTPRSFYHRIYRIVGTLGAMEIDLGSESGGKILLCRRFSSAADREEYHFDYLGRNHYNGDAYMLRHAYFVARDRIEPDTSVVQAYFAEALGFCAVTSAHEGRHISVDTIIPDDLKFLLKKDIFADNAVKNRQALGV